MDSFASAINRYWCIATSYFSSDAIKRKRSTMGLYFENHSSTMRRQDKDRDFSILFDGIC